MIEKTRKNIYHSIFIFLLVTICPVSVLASVGTWLPLLISAIILLFLKQDFFLETKKNKLVCVLLLFFSWLTISLLFINSTFDSAEKLLHVTTIALSGFIITYAGDNYFKFKKIIVFFSLSFILSALIIFIDNYYQIGLKLWLSLNFDFSNFNSLYSIKEWKGLRNFQIENTENILRYLDNTYDRGITTLSIFALPIIAICYFYNLKLMAILVFLLCLLSLLSLFNLTALFSFLFALLFFIFSVYTKCLYKNIILIFIGIYFLSAPFILGNLDYKNFATYEKEVEQELLYLKNKYPNNLKVSNKCSYNKNTKSNECYKILPATTLKGFILTIKNPKIFIAVLKYYKLSIYEKLIHRKVIWSFSKEKILEKPFFGHGFFTSRELGSNFKITNIYGKKISAIPLHPHNGILQIWLELGIIGVILFYIFIATLVYKINSISKINFSYSAISYASLMQVFIISQLSYGFWQSWWLAIIAVNIFLYKILFKNITKFKQVKE